MTEKNTLEQKLDRLEEILSGYGQMLVALSGGVDSIFLTAFAYRLWGDDRIAALTASGPHFAPDEVEYAREFCERLGISHKIQDVSFIMPVIEENPPDRCYHCKKAIFSELVQRAQMVGSVLADGTNLSDMDDYRPVSYTHLPAADLEFFCRNNVKVFHPQYVAMSGIRYPLVEVVLFSREQCFQHR